MSSSASERPVGYWLGIFANLSVVAGIVFLAMEVRHNAEATRAEIKNALSECSRYQGLWAAEHPEVLELDRRWAAGDTLSEVEWFQLDGLYYARWKNLENAFYQYRAGTLEQAEWEAYERIIELRTGAATHSAYLTQNAFRFSTEFIDHVNALGPPIDVSTSGLRAPRPTH